MKSRQHNNPFENKIIWNPWHGCHRCSEGCKNCYIFIDDIARGINTNNIHIVKSNFKMPVRKIRNKRLEKYELEYRIPSGSHIVVCNTSDFFIEEADTLRIEAWDFINERNDCLFEITTKRPERIKQCLPDNWLDGWKNVIINVTVENEIRAWERIPQLLEIETIKHKGIVMEPMLEYFDIWQFLSSGEIEQVILGGESYIGNKGKAHELELKWVRKIKEQCEEYEVPFYFHQTGSRLTLDNGNIINISNKIDEYGLARFYGLDIIEAGGINWKITAQELEKQSLAEDAHRIYKKIQSMNT